MKNEDVPKAPKRQSKFNPKIPPRKVPKTGIVKNESSETKDDLIDKKLLAKLSEDATGRRVPNFEKKVAPAQVAFGYRDSTVLRTYGNTKGNIVGNQEASASASGQRLEKEYVEPWDYLHSYYPAILPLRRPYSGDPDILNKEEFGEAPAGSSQAKVEARINAAEELGLLENSDEPRLLFFQLPAKLPITKRTDAAVDPKSRPGKAPDDLKGLPGGFMGKLLVYKSGIVKMKIGDTLFDVSPGAKCSFAQDVAAINTKEKHCCILGDIEKRVMVTPDVDALLDSIDKL